MTKPTLSLTLLSCFIYFSTQAQVTGDFQSKNTAGNWSDFNSWNVYNGTSWAAATSGQLPTSATAVFVQNGHTIIVDNAASVCNDLNVSSGGTFGRLAFAATGVLNVKGSITINSSTSNYFSPWVAGGKLIFSGSGNQAIIGLTVGTILEDVEINKSSGTVTMAGFNGSITGFNGSISGTLTLTAGTLNIGANGSLTLNGASLIRTAGFLAGTNTSDLTVTGTTGGTVIIPQSGNISLRNVTISGTRTVVMNGINDLNLSGAFTVGSTATFDNGGENQILQNSGGSVIIDGKFITKDVEGFTGTSAAIPGITPVLNTGCTIEFGLTGNQIFNARSDYKNITFS